MNLAAILKLYGESRISDKFLKRSLMLKLDPKVFYFHHKLTIPLLIICKVET